MIKRARRIERVGGLSVLFYFDLSRYIPDAQRLSSGLEKLVIKWKKHSCLD